MAELRPIPFPVLVRRLLADLRGGDKVFDLPLRKAFRGSDSNFAIAFHDSTPSCALGPAAGPQTQMAQNLVLSYLGGCRVMELKTVQINDRLEIPRPCIDMQTIGYNVEWSQELRLQESLEEYVKGHMLIEILLASGDFELPESHRDYVFDMSVGYDLAGIQSPTVQAFIDGMMNCSTLIDKFRAEIPDEFAKYRELDFRPELSRTLTLSTFHGCPPDEIEKIMEFLLTEKGLHSIVKLNPTLLGPKRARELLNDQLGYSDIAIPDSAFANDTQWDQAREFVGRLGELGEKEGRGFGVKFSNTLLVDNHRDFFPAEEKSMYLSGPPLHVLAMNLVADFRKEFGDRYPISFSAGIDRNNFADAVALGLTPVTVCSDLLKPGGYGRASGYLDTLHSRMSKVGAATIDDYVLQAYAQGQVALDGVEMPSDRKEKCAAALAAGTGMQEAAGDCWQAWRSAAVVKNTEHYRAQLNEDKRYRLESNTKLPKKVGSELALLDCVSCNKCVPVCPNDANFSLKLPADEIDNLVASCSEGAWKVESKGKTAITKKVQYANFADLCNECGNCDIFCPEDGGPYVVKPRFFGSLDDFREFSDHDGFCFEGEAIHARFGGKAFSCQPDSKGVAFAGDGFSLVFDPASKKVVSGQADDEVDLSYLFLILLVRDGVFSDESDNYLRYSSSR